MRMASVPGTRSCKPTELSGARKRVRCSDLLGGCTRPTLLKRLNLNRGEVDFNIMFVLNRVKLLDLEGETACLIARSADNDGDLLEATVASIGYDETRTAVGVEEEGATKAPGLVRWVPPERR